MVLHYVVSTIVTHLIYNTLALLKLKEMTKDFNLFDQLMMTILFSYHLFLHTCVFKLCVPVKTVY